jgi:hypothetical protein
MNLKELTSLAKEAAFEAGKAILEDLPFNRFWGGNEG